MMRRVAVLFVLASLPPGSGQTPAIRCGALDCGGHGVSAGLRPGAPCRCSCELGYDAADACKTCARNFARAPRSGLCVPTAAARAGASLQSTEAVPLASEAAPSHQSVEPIEATPSVEATPSFEAAPSVETSETSPSLETTPSVEANEVTPSFEATPSVESIETTPSLETTPSVEANEVTPSFEATPSVESIETTPSLETTPSFEAPPVGEVTPSVEATPDFEATPADSELSQSLRRDTSVGRGAEPLYAVAGRAALAAVMFGSTAVSGFTRAAVLLDLQCAADAGGDSPRPFAPELHPLRFGVGGGASRYLWGTVLGNLAALAGVSAALLAASFTLKLFAPGSAGAVQPALLQAPCLFLLQGTSLAACHMIFLPGDFVSGLVGAAVLAACCGGVAVVWRSVLRPASNRCTAMRDPRLIAGGQGELRGLRRRAYIAFFGPAVWTARTAGDRGFARRHAAVFGEFREGKHHLALLNPCSALALSAAAACRPGSAGGCLARDAAVALLFGGCFAAVAWHRPFLSAVDNCLARAGAAATFAAALGAAAGWRDAAAAALAAAIVACVAKTAYDAALIAAEIALGRRQAARRSWLDRTPDAEGADGLDVSSSSCGGGSGGGDEAAGGASLASTTRSVASSNSFYSSVKFDSAATHPFLPPVPPGSFALAPAQGRSPSVGPPQKDEPQAGRRSPRMRALRASMRTSSRSLSIVPPQNDEPQAGQRTPRMEPLSSRSLSIVSPRNDESQTSQRMDPLGISSRSLSIVSPRNDELQSSQRMDPLGISSRSLSVVSPRNDELQSSQRMDPLGISSRSLSIVSPRNDELQSSQRMDPFGISSRSLSTVSPRNDESQTSQRMNALGISSRSLSVVSPQNDEPQASQRTPRVEPLGASMKSTASATSSLRRHASSVRLPPLSPSHPRPARASTVLQRPAAAAARPPAPRNSKLAQHAGLPDLAASYQQALHRQRSPQEE
ncbi:Cell surface glycoprotein 1 [Diplonema papillatum]|nr:Cell surface glycoprotein 1 [Diplonema papillatum]